MAKQFVSDLKTGEPVDSVFLVRSKELKTTRGGAAYLVLDLCDRTGTIRANLWDATEAAFEAVAGNDFVKVKGRVETYQNKLQLNLKRFDKVDPAGLQMGDFLRQTDKDVHKLLADLRSSLAEIKDEHIAKLVKAFLEDTAFCKKFKEAPAAVQNHHAYLGGLLEHTVSMLQFAKRVCESYPSLRRDLLMAGVFLHDIGKIHEFAYDLSLQYTDAGGLIGHLVIGCSMIEEKAKQIEGFPPDLLLLIEHMILSHHGEYEFGSPKLPSTAEAIALHYIDNMDAKLTAIEDIIAGDTNGDSHWTQWQFMFDRRIYKK